MLPASPLPDAEPAHDCPLCPRLAGLRETLRVEQPDWWNAPVNLLGDPEAWLVIVGLAPGRRGANRTGRPFTGDSAGALLFQTLANHGLIEGEYADRVDDTLALNGVIIANAVKCLPPQNKPTPEEIRTCRPFLARALDMLPKARTVIALGQVAHQSAVKAMGGKLPKCRFGHGAEHRMPDGRVLIDSYHCSRYNQNTGRVTAEMLDSVFARAVALRG